MSCPNCLILRNFAHSFALRINLVSTILILMKNWWPEVKQTNKQQKQMKTILNNECYNVDFTTHHHELERSTRGFISCQQASSREQTLSVTLSHAKVRRTCRTPNIWSQCHWLFSAGQLILCAYSSHVYRYVIYEYRNLLLVCMCGAASCS